MYLLKFVKHHLCRQVLGNLLARPSCCHSVALRSCQLLVGNVTVATKVVRPICDLSQDALICVDLSMIHIDMYLQIVSPFIDYRSL